MISSEAPRRHTRVGTVGQVDLLTFNPLGRFTSGRLEMPYALQDTAPSVTMPHVSDAFGVNLLGVASIVGMFYCGYSPFSLVAGAA